MSGGFREKIVTVLTPALALWLVLGRWATRQTTSDQATGHGPDWPPPVLLRLMAALLPALEAKNWLDEVRSVLFEARPEKYTRYLWSYVWKAPTLTWLAWDSYNRRMAAAEQEEWEQTVAREVRASYVHAQATVLAFGLSARIFLDMCTRAEAGLDRKDLLTQLRLVRWKYLEAELVIGRLWALCPHAPYLKFPKLPRLTTEARAITNSAAAVERVELQLWKVLEVFNSDVVTLASSVRACDPRPSPPLPVAVGNDT
jgi:hypothetical protein